MAPRLLIDSLPFKVAFEEGKDGKKKLIARGEHARFMVPTDNNRLYPRSVWEANKNRLRESLKRRRVFGELDHPGDGKTKLQRVSHLTTGFDIDDTSGVVVAEDEVLDTPNGRILKALVDAGCEVGVSSRGFGSVKTDENGIEVVQDDYRLLAWDFVADPAMRTAYPQIFAEESKIPEGDMDLKILKKEYPDLYKEIVESAQAEAKENAEKALTEAREVSEKAIQEAVDAAKKKVEEDMKGKFSDELMREMEKVREKAEETVRGELLSDPEVAGAKTAMAAVTEALSPYMVSKDAEEVVKAKDGEITSLKKSLAEKELEVGQLKHDNDELAVVAKKAAYMLHLERSLIDDKEETRQAVVELIGKVEDFNSPDEIDAKVEAIKAELERRSSDSGSAEKEEELKKKVEELEEKEKKIEELMAQNSKLMDEMKKVAKLAEQMKEQMEVQAHATKRLVGHPSASDKRLLRQLEAATTVGEVDEIFDEFEVNAKDEDEMGRIRARVQRGKERDIYEDTHGKKKGGEEQAAYDPLAEIGLSMEEVVRNSGLAELTEDGQFKH